MNRRRVAQAVATAGVAIAAQVASKAARDGIFLGTFDATQLPRAVIAATGLSVLAVAGMGWALRRYGVSKVVPGLFFVSAALFAADWWLVGTFPKVGAAMVFCHVSSVGALLISGFWSLVTSSFDARSARKHLGTIGTGATLGGLAGGLAAERLAAAVGAPNLLLVIAAAQLICALLCTSVSDSSDAPIDTQIQSKTKSAPSEIFANAYLRRLGLMVILLAAAAGLLDFLLKFEAQSYFANRDELTRFFGVFYTGTALFAFLLQASLGRGSLERLGLTATAAALPVVLLCGSVGFLMIPSLVAAIVGRGGDNIIRSSLFRSSYELLFAPLPAEQRNRVKAWIDVGCERLGDALAGVLVQGLLIFATASVFIAGSAVVLSAGALLAVLWLARGYVGQVADRLSGVEPEPQVDAAMATIGLSGIDLSRIIPHGDGFKKRDAPTSGDKVTTIRDPWEAQIVALRSSDVATVKEALAMPLPPACVPLAIEALSRETVADAATAALAAVAESHTGQLIDALLDPDEPVATRTRIPGILSMSGGDRADAGLYAGLADLRFQVRLRCAEVLLARRKTNKTRSPMEQVLEAIKRELHKTKSIRFQERLSRSGLAYPARKTDQPKVYLLLTLLALVRPIEPVANAYQALQTNDKKLRGLALEYLASVAPVEIRTALIDRLDASSTWTPTSNTSELEQSLRQSMPAVNASLLQENDND